MRKIILSLFIAALGTTVNGQLRTPEASPFSKVEQKVGLTDVALEYSRPGMKGRTIFGGLVPYGKIWRTGANANTKISFSTAVVIDGKKLKKGSYAIYTIPHKDFWDIVFYNELDKGIRYKLDDAKIALKTTAKVSSVPMKTETFTITFDHLTNDSAVLGMLWENTHVGVTFKTPTDEIVTKGINEIMSGPSASDYYQSAVYYFQTGKDLKKAKEWIDKAMDMMEQPGFWHLRQKSLIYAAAGDKQGAIAAAKASLAGAEKYGNEDYIRMNRASLKEWGAM